MTMKAPRALVSIGIPVYNGEQLIREALDALRAQTYDNLELIISDNASTDRTSEICQDYATKDRRIKYYRNPTNVGVYANYRRVVTLATGEYFMWAAADDLKPADAIERCVNALSCNHRAVMAHGVVLVRTPDALFEFPNVVQASDSNAAARIRRFTRGIEHNAMQYGLYRLKALRQATLGSHMAPEYLLLLQIFLFGEVEYVAAPLIIFRQRQKEPPTRTAMYREVPLTFRNILNCGRLRRRKCWTALLLGCYYLARRGNVPFSERLSSIAAHIITFCSVYRRRLAKEVVFQLSEPFAWLCTLVMRRARQRPRRYGLSAK